MLNFSLQKFVFILFLLLAFVGSASATNYYASPTGTGNGLSINSPGNAETIVENLKAGDTLYLLDGKYLNTRLYFSQSGNSNNPITITAYSGTPTLYRTDYGGSEGTIVLDNANYININGIKVDGVYNAFASSGSHIRVSNCDFGNVAGTAVYIGDPYRVGITDVTLYNCKIHDSNMLGDSGPNMIEIEGNQQVDSNGKVATYISLRNCDIYGHSLHQTINVMNCAPGAPSGGVQFTNSGLKYLTIDGCSIHDIGTDGIYSIYGDFQYANFTNNKVYNLPRYGINAKFDYSNISNNQFWNIGSSTPNSHIYLYASSGTTHQSHDDIIANNTMDYPGRIRIESGTNMKIARNTVSAYYLIGCGDTDITDGNPVAKSGSNPGIEIQNVGSVGQIRAVYTDGASFTETGANSIKYENGQSILNLLSNEDIMITNVLHNNNLIVSNSNDVTTSKTTSSATSENPSVPVAEFIGSVTSGTAPLYVQFTDKSSRSPTSWAWDFGDGTTSTVKNPMHKYSKSGKYTVSLTVNNAAGSNTITKSSYISVADNTYIKKSRYKFR